MKFKLMKFYFTNYFLSLLTEELDGPNAGRIKDAWVIAVER